MTLRSLFRPSSPADRPAAADVGAAHARGEASGVRGMYPGGPGRRSRGAVVEARLRHGEWVEARLDEHRVRRARSGRRRVRWTLLMVMSVVAGSLGFALGRVDRSDESEGAGAPSELLRGEANRVLLELWKMESLELPRGLR